MFADLLREAESLAKALRAGGVSERSLVGVCVSMSSEYLVSVLALYNLSAVPLLLNPTATSYENGYICRDSGLNFLLTDQQERTDLVTSGNRRQWRNLWLTGPVTEQQTDISSNDCMIIYTSGSTGRAKGVVLTRDGISSNVRAVANYLALSSVDRTIVFTPPAFAYAVSQTLTHLWSGGAIFPWPLGLRYPGEVLSAIERHRITGIAANPTSLRILLKHARSPGNSSSLRYLMMGGQPLDSQLAIEISRFFPTARIVNMYGCTENSPRVAFYWLPPSPPVRDTPWPVGHAILGTRIKLVDDASNAVGPSREKPGEILIQGTSLMRRYWRDPDLTRRKIIDGWFHTGDLGFVDSDGCLHLTGRLDNLFSVGHVKVSPEEVENLLENVPGVREAAVVPVYDELLGSIPVALVVLDREQDNALAQVTRECDFKLSTAKRPRSLFPVRSLPRTHYGKLDRKELRDLAEKLAHTKRSQTLSKT